MRETIGRGLDALDVLRQLNLRVVDLVNDLLIYKPAAQAKELTISLACASGLYEDLILGFTEFINKPLTVC